MAKAFHIIGQVLLSIIGVAMIVMGGIWILQGFGIAFLDSFMANDLAWARNGAVLALVGLVQLAWTNTRRRYYRQR
ncbi:MAG: hypothetical protein RLZZ08_1662 [Pseudomonadota bacterium]|jgi:hypothetical protein